MPKLTCRLGALVAFIAFTGVQATAAAPAPEPLLTDPLGDLAVAGLVEIDLAALANVDVASAWVGDDSPDSWVVAVLLAGNGVPSPLFTFDYEVAFKVQGHAFEATATLTPTNPQGNGTVTAGGVARQARFEGGVLLLTMAKASLGNPPDGTAATGLVVRTQASLLTALVAVAQDRAPDEGTGSPYTFLGSATPPVDGVDAEPAAPPTASDPVVTGSALAAASSVTASLVARRLRP